MQGTSSKSVNCIQITSPVWFCFHICNISFLWRNMKVNQCILVSHSDLTKWKECLILPKFEKAEAAFFAHYILNSQCWENYSKWELFSLLKFINFNTSFHSNCFLIALLHLLQQACPLGHFKKYIFWTVLKNTS